MAHGMTRREFAAAAGLAGLGLRGPANAADTKTLRFIAQSDLRVLDPIWTTAYITRNHGYMAPAFAFFIGPPVLAFATIGPPNLTA
jgi:hypothetical protein